MRKIDEIENEIGTIRAKLDINARDWNKAEKEAIAKAYFEITRISTIGSTGGGMASTGFKGRGRILDTGCDSCINSAVNIIRNYLNAIDEPLELKEVKSESVAALKIEEVVDKDNNSIEEAGNIEDTLLFAPTNKNWRRNHQTVDAAAKELDFVFPEALKTKDDKIKALEKYIKEINE